MQHCTHVFIRYDGVKSPLQRPYDGPYRVITRNDKFFTLSVKGKLDTVSIDRLKPACLKVMENVESPSLDVPLDDHLSNCDLFEDVNKTTALNSTNLDDLPAGSYYDRRGRLIRRPKRYES